MTLINEIKQAFAVMNEVRSTNRPNIEIETIEQILLDHNVQAAMDLYEMVEKSDSADIECEGRTLAETYILSKRDNSSQFNVAPYYHSDRREFTGSLLNCITYIKERTKECKR